MIVMWWRGQRKWLELKEILTFIRFVAKTTELTISNLSLWWQILTANHHHNLFYLILECPDPCECNVFHQTIVSVNCSGKSFNSIPWKFPPAMSKLWVLLKSYKHQENIDPEECFCTKSPILRGIPLMLL